MARVNFKDYVDSLKSLYGLAGGIGVLIPGATYFSKYPPPLLPAISLFTAMIALATFFLAYLIDFKANKTKKILLLSFAASILILISYFVLFGLTTIQDPQGKRVYQIGFHKCDWSLTQEGKSVKSLYPMKTIEEWMLQDALFKRGGPEILWKKWTIETAGVVLAVLFLFSFVLWVFAWGIVAKSKLTKK
jgi:energy-coupling factor transporter transmembrane protein EcfT